MSREKRDLTRITVNLPTGVLEKIDSWAASVGLSRTTAITIMCADYLAHLELNNKKEDE